MFGKSGDELSLDIFFKVKLRGYVSFGFDIYFDEFYKSLS